MKCYLCNSPVTKFLSKNGYTVFRCGICGLARTDLGKDYLRFVEEHYDKGYFTGDPTRSAYVDYKDDKQYIVRNLEKFLKRIRRYKSRGTLLDVGCALGFFVERAIDNGFDAYGLDTSSYATAEARKLVAAHRIQQGTIGEVQYKPKFFDVITLFDIFEHLADPRSDLQRLYQWLKDDGIIVIATGDTESLLARLLGRKWTFYIPPQHLFFFNKKNLTTLLRQVHFLPVEWFCISKWLSLRYVFHLARTTGESMVAQWVYPLMKYIKVGKLPIYMPVRDNMVVVARKKM